MTDYEKAVMLWKSKNITNGDELSAALNGQSIAFAYHSGKIENENITYNDTREIFDRDGVTSYTGDLKTLFELVFLLAFRALHGDQDLLSFLDSFAGLAAPDFLVGLVITKYTAFRAVDLGVGDEQHEMDHDPGEKQEDDR